MAASAAKGAGAVAAPLQQLLTTKSGSFGTGLTVVKAASAASLAFAISDHLGPPRFASLGAVVAVFTVQSSIVSTLGQGLQRVLGNILGVALASLWVQRVGTSWWSLLIALLVAIAGARRLPLGFAGQAQIPISVLLTVALGPATAGYGHWRVVDTVIGGAVGILVGVGIPERPSFAPARQAQSAWGEALVEQLDAIAKELESGERPMGDHGRHDFIESSRALAATVAAGGAATTVAEEGIYLNPRGRRQKNELELLQRREQELARMTLQIRVLSLTIDQLYDRPEVAPRLERRLLAQLVRRAAELFRARRAGLDILADSLALRAEIAHAVQIVTSDESDAYAVLDSVSLLGRVEQLRQEITVDASLGASPGAAEADHPASG
jgi:uncharacterized membrane protein YgaE (UPF0421/DUF939 family)